MEKIEKIAYDILSSPLKKIVLEELSYKPQPASYLARKKQKQRASISRIFKTLTKLGITQCNNTWHHRFRFYSLTDFGKEVYKKIKEIEK